MADARAITREAIDLAVDLTPLPPWVPRWAAKAVLGALVATIVVLAVNIDVPALLAAWAKAATPGPVPQAPPLPMPEGGLPLDQQPMEPQP